MGLYTTILCQSWRFSTDTSSIYIYISQLTISYTQYLILIRLIYFDIICTGPQYVVQPISSDMLHNLNLINRILIPANTRAFLHLINKAVYDLKYVMYLFFFYLWYQKKTH